MPLVLGHRGCIIKCLENSMHAFQTALALGLDGIELDARQTQDGAIIVMHDATLDRTCSGPFKLGLCVSECQLKDLPGLKNGEPVPLVANVLQSISRTVNIELKDQSGPKVATMVQSLNSFARVIFSSFDHLHMRELAKAFPESICGLLWKETDARALTAVQLSEIPPHFLLHIPYSVFADPTRQSVWAQYAQRVVLWDVQDQSYDLELVQDVAVLIVDL